MENLTYKHIQFFIAPAIGAALIGAGGSIVNGLTSLFGGSSSASKDYNRSKKLMQFQNDLNLQNWNAMNTYNTPAAIRQRQRAAGMNPLLHDLEGAAQPMAAVGQSSFSGSAQEQANRQAAISNMTAAANVAAQTALIKKQAENVQADTENKKAELPKIQRESTPEWLDEEYLTKWWNNNISSQSFVYHYASSILQAKRAGLSPNLPDGRGSKIYSNHDEFDFNVSYDDAAKWVKTEFDDMVASLDLKRSQESYFYKTASAAFGNLAVALSRASHQNNLDDANAELQRAAKEMQELKTFMMHNGFNENDSPLDRMIKKFGEFIGIDFALPE